jgi:acetyl-CoA acetyltransferase
VGRVKGVLASVRPDHLSADVIRGLLARNPWLDPASIDDVYWRAANQAGEDNRNVARMSVLLAGLPVEVPGATVNRLCGAGMEAIAKRPAFRQGGTVTGGNSSPLNDGAAVLVLASERAAAASGQAPMARYAGTAAAGVHPDYMGIGPVPALGKALARAGWQRPPCASASARGSRPSGEAP